ncbi:MAG TPA: hypothetical protein VN380_15910 [Thermoanaerobaculia bacterium]|jgi:hypothetical protein|nr:hypothetical protein [Thermoanaerobaculia bacterium]
MIGLKRARQLLTPYYPRLYRIVTEAVAISRSVAEAHPYFDATTIANAAHDAMCDIARREFPDGVPGVGVVDINCLTMIHIENILFLKLKKFDPTLRSRTYPTLQYREMRGQGRLPGLGETCTTAEIGYVLRRPLLTDIESVHVVFVLDKTLIWDIPLEDGGVEGEIFEMPLLFPDDGESESETTANPRKGRGTKSGETDAGGKKRQ